MMPSRCGPQVAARFSDSEACRCGSRAAPEPIEIAATPAGLHIASGPRGGALSSWLRCGRYGTSASLPVVARCSSARTRSPSPRQEPDSLETRRGQLRPRYLHYQVIASGAMWDANSWFRGGMRPMKTRSLFRSPKNCGLSGVLLLSIMLTLTIPRVAAAELWNYIRVEKDYRADPQWVARNGKARVEIRGNHIEIRIDYADTEDSLDKAAVKIVGTIRVDNTVNATCTFMDTDTSPIQLNGRYFTRNDLQIWGVKRKLIKYEEIVFSRSANIDFLGVVTREVRDE
jgi:hypothetical protein